MTLKDMKSSSAVILGLLILLLGAPSAHALDADSELVRSLARHVSRTLVVESAMAPLPSRAVAPTAATMPAAFSVSPAAIIHTPIEALELPARAASPSSKAFPILASTYVALNALDIYTTTRAVSSGRGVEANPVLGFASQTPTALTAAKIATTATTLVLAHRLWKQQHRTASIALLVVGNIGTGLIVGHNAQVAGRF